MIKLLQDKIKELELQLKSKNLTCSTTIGDDSSKKIIKLKKNFKESKEIPQPTIDEISKIDCVHSKFMIEDSNLKNYFDQE